ncbi:MAG: hypothetical protein U0P81_08485 [Holophagaceae bacterium]
MRRLTPAILLTLAACGSPEAGYLARPEARVALDLVDQTPSGPAGLGPEGLAAYRAALEARFAGRLVAAGPGVGTLRIVLTGLQEAEYRDPGLVGVASAALTRNPALVALSLARLETRTQAKLDQLGYPIRVPEASFVLLPPNSDRPSAFKPISPDAIILAHPKLMHGERGQDQRLKAEAEAFALAVEAQVRKAYGWPSASRG